jgi:hypothetical protein
MKIAALFVGLVMALSALAAPSAASAATRPTKAIRVALSKLDRAARATRGATTRRKLVRAVAAIRRSVLAGGTCKALDRLAKLPGRGTIGRRAAALASLLGRRVSRKGCRAPLHVGVSAQGKLHEGGRYPPGLFAPAESEQGEDEEEEGVPPLPVGPARAIRDKTPPVPDEAAVPRTASRSANPLGFAAGTGDALTAFVNTSLDKAPKKFGVVVDPSGAMAGETVLLGGNTWLAWSKDRGKTFTYTEISTVFSDSPDGGMCCDQQIQYDPKTNLFVWLLQYYCKTSKCDVDGKRVNRYRVAVATPQDVVSSGATKWKTWDFLSSSFVGQNWLDYPSMAIGSNSLWFTANSPSKGGAIWVRVKMADLKNKTAGQSLPYRWLDATDSYSLETAQNAGSIGYVISQSSTSQLRVRSWDDSSIYVYSHYVDIASIPNQGCKSLVNGTDWMNFGCGFPGTRVQGVTLADGKLWAAWVGMPKNSDGDTVFPNPHIETARISTGTWNLLDQKYIWNSGFSFVYPHIASNTNKEVGVSYMSGGGTNGYPRPGFGVLTGTRHFVKAANGAANVYTRYGDYTEVRRAGPTGELWAAFGYRKFDVSGVTEYHPQFTLFGRSSDAPPPPLPPPPPPIVIAPPPPIVIAPPPPPAPDLIVVPGVSSRQWHVRNAGNAPAGPSIVSVTNDPDPTFAIPTLAAGETSPAFIVACGANKVAAADSTKVVAESNETNNTLVLACPVP